MIEYMFGFSVCVCTFPFFFYFLCTHITVSGDIEHCSCSVHTLFTGPITTLFRKNIKNWSHDTIHTFKNYFATVFLVFSKISCIQMDPEFAFAFKYKITRPQSNIQFKKTHGFRSQLHVWVLFFFLVLRPKQKQGSWTQYLLF